ncbi:iron ABC transporter permease [Marinobacter sp.]|uniref:FecCD family ABC transporter permease n=1 Tax=Marinobacter sp. TaxID=50741 RepID=UPI002353C6E1|nr:iron ABC transporter permease [Marinobacter sp.]
MLNPKAAKALGLLLSLALVGATLVASLILGQITVTSHDLYNSLFSYSPGDLEHLVVRSERVPRTVIALVVGAGLAVSGVLMQSLTRNPLASPGILGINAGALFLVVVGASLFSLTAPSQLIWLAFIGAAVAASLVYFLGHEPGRGVSPVRIVLAGVALTAMFVSFAQGLLILNQERFESMLFWIAGSVSGRSLEAVAPLLPVIGVGLLLSLVLSRQLNLLGLDDEVTQGLGMNVGQIRLLTGLLVIILAGTSVAIAGLIGFVGLIVPHIARGVLGTDHRWLIPGSALIGGALLMGSDTLARLLIPPREVPIGVVTALMGTPLFLYLARRTGNSS